VQTQLPKPPECPRWCRSRHPLGDGWTIDEGGTYKRCERHIVVDAVQDYTLELFADVDEDGAVHIEGPYVRTMGRNYPLEAALHCCAAVIELVGMAGMADASPVVAA
jgi:hypothetical protein